MIPYNIEQININEEQILSNPSRKEEMVKIILQTLNNLGLEQTVESLEQESNIFLENSLQIKIRQSIILGQWKRSIDLLKTMDLIQKDLNLAIFFVLEQKFLELVESKNLDEALKVVRFEMPVVSQDTQKIHLLGSLSMTQTIDELKQYIGWQGAGIESRKILLEKIYAVFKNNNQMIPPNRLETLIKQSKCYQSIQCKNHSQLDPNFSIINDHQCDDSDIPTKVIQQENQHRDEVWIVKFSPNGNYLASIAKNQSLIVWEFKENHINKFSRADKIHEKEIHCLNWNFDSNLIGTASADVRVKIWNLKCELCHVLKGHTDIVTSVLFHPKQKYIFTAGIDQFIMVWNLEGEKQYKLNSERNKEMHITSDGFFLIAINAIQDKVSIIDIQQKVGCNQIKEKDCIISSYLSKDDKYLLLNVSYKNPEIHIWSLESFEFINRFFGYKQQMFTLRCCMGWFKEQLIACGSEDGTLFIWHKNHNKPINVLISSDASINCVTWHPTIPGILVTAHDDNFIQVWGSKNFQPYQNKRKENILDKMVKFLKKKDFLKKFFKNNEIEEDSQNSQDINENEELDIEDLEDDEFIEDP